MLFGQFRTPLMGACALALVFVPLAKAQSTLFNWPGGCQVYNVPTASCPPVTFTGAWAPATTYQLNQVVTYSGSQYISIQNSNTGQNPATATAYWAQPFISGNPTVGQTLTWNGSSFGLAVAGAANVKLFGATGNGTTDDTAAIQNALAFMATNGGCIYFPAGVYKTAAQLNWNNMLTPSGTAAAPLCLRGDSAVTSLSTAGAPRWMRRSTLRIICLPKRLLPWTSQTSVLPRTSTPSMRSTVSPWGRHQTWIMWPSRADGSRRLAAMHGTA